MAAGSANTAAPASDHPAEPPTNTGQRPLLLLIDGHSLAFRSFYAFSKGGAGGLATKEGVHTSGTYGSLKALVDTCRGLKPPGGEKAVDPAEVAEQRDAWLQEWTEITTR